MRTVDGTVANCRLLTELFPDYNLMVSLLPAVTHRLTVEKQRLLKALDRQTPERISLQIAAGQPSVPLPHCVVELDGNASGPDLTVFFEMTTRSRRTLHANYSRMVNDGGTRGVVISLAKS